MYISEFIKQAGEKEKMRGFAEHLIIFSPTSLISSIIIYIYIYIYIHILGRLQEKNTTPQPNYGKDRSC